MKGKSIPGRENYEQRLRKGTEASEVPIIQTMLTTLQNTSRSATLNLQKNPERQ